VAGDIEGDTEVVGFEDQPDFFERSHDLQAQGPDPERVHVASQAPAESHVVLPAGMTQADESVEHVVVAVEANVAGECDRARLVRGAHVVTVVPARVTAGNCRERLGDLVDRVLVESRQHDASPSCAQFRMSSLSLETSRRNDG
jgi:hypothetical protein